MFSYILIMVAGVSILYRIINAGYRSSDTSNQQFQKYNHKSEDFYGTPKFYPHLESEISTRNSFLYEQEMKKNIYIVNQVFFNLGNTNNDDYSLERVFNNGSNEKRLEIAQKYYDITCQNILFKRRMGETVGRNFNSFIITLSCIQNNDGIIEKAVLKSINQDRIDMFNSII